MKGSEGCCGQNDAGNCEENAMISVVVPVYNMESYLCKCLDSIHAQTYPDFELLLVDDGSTDGSAKICDDYSKKDMRITVYHKENGGLSSARNCGLNHAKGDFIVFPDPDDWVEPDYLESLLALRERHGADLSICGLSFFDNAVEKRWDPDTTTGLLNTEEALDTLMHPYKYCGFVWNKLFDLKVIRGHNLRFDEELASIEDLRFSFRYILLCAKIVYDPTPLYHYRAGGGTDMAGPLTERKMSGLQTYYKIAELARNSRYPRFEAVAYRSLFDLCLSHIYSYYRWRMRDTAVLQTLKETLEANKKYYFPNDVYSVQHNNVAKLALINTRLYYYVLRTKRLFSGQDKNAVQRDNMKK